MLNWLFGRKKLKDSEIVYPVRQGPKEYVYMGDGMMMEDLRSDLEKQREVDANIHEVKRVEPSQLKRPQEKKPYRGSSSSSRSTSSSSSYNSSSNDAFIATAAYSSYDSGSSYSSCDSGSSSSSCD